MTTKPWRVTPCAGCSTRSRRTAPTSRWPALSSDAFRKQYSRAEVTSIDKMVLWSPNQAQVLFTMRVAPASGSTRDQTPNNEEQAIAQLLSQDNEILVCSYLPRTAGQY